MNIFGHVAKHYRKVGFCLSVHMNFAYLYIELYHIKYEP